MVFAEANFPRGGVAKISNVPIGEPKIEFGAATQKSKKPEKLNKKQRKDKRKNELQENDTEIEAVSAELLSNRTITEGMIIMGAIKEIHTTHVIVALPGRLYGYVSVTSISTSYLNILNQYVNDVKNENNFDDYKSIENLYEIGQIVCVKLIQIDTADEQNTNSRYKINLSMAPADINRDLIHNNIVEGIWIPAAVESVEDHGYVMETGVKNLRGFLHKTMVHDGTQYGIGEVVFCYVDKIKVTSAASTATFKTVKSKELKLIDDMNMTYILPSIICKFKVTKCLKDGIQGTIYNDTFTAYVNEHQLGTPLSSPDDYKIDSEHNARILYIMPITKLVYLSLNLNETITPKLDETIKIGDIIDNARVVRIGTCGLILRMNGNVKGIVSLKSIRIGSGLNFDTDDLLSKYYKNSAHRVRVIGCDQMDSAYICSLEEKILNEKYFSMDDVEVGDFVDVKISTALGDGGYFVRIGKLAGYIEKLHLSPRTPTAKLVPGAKLRCRILRKNEKDQKIFLTNRKEMMAENACILKSYEDAVVGLEYTGMIVKIFPDRYLVGFGNYVKGMLYTKTLDAVSENTTRFFYEGQIMKFRVAKTDGSERLTLGLSEFQCQTGIILQGRISTIQPSGLHIAFKNSKFNGFVPTMLLSAFPNLVQIAQHTYQPDESVEAVCVTQNVYSIKDVFTVQHTPIKKWRDLAIGDVVPAFVKNVSGDIIDLLLFVENFTKIVKIHTKMLLEDPTQTANINLIAEQILYVKILGKNMMMNRVTCSAKLSDVWPGNLRETAQIFTQYFNDLDRIRSKINNTTTTPQQQLLKIGDIITCTIDSIKSGGSQSFDEKRKIFVKLPSDNQMGVINSANCSKNPVEIGQKIECLVLWIDYANNIIYLTMKLKHIERMRRTDLKDAKKFLKISRGIRSDVLLVLDDVIITQPRKLTNQFIYIPTRFHYNDLQPFIMNGIEEGDIANVTVIDSSSGNHIIGMFEYFCTAFNAIEGPPISSKTNKRKGVKVEHKKSSKRPCISEGETINFNDIVDSDNDNDNENENLNSIDNKCLFITDTKGSNGGGGGGGGKEPNFPTSSYSFKFNQLDGANDDFPDSSDDNDNIVLNNNKDDIPMPNGQVNKNQRLTRYRKNFKKLIKPDKKSHKKQNSEKLPTLPGVKNFWTTDLNEIIKSSTQASSGESDTDEPSTKPNASKKRRLTAAERFQAVRSEEARIAKIEESYANCNFEPTTVDDFERLILATPSCSKTWISYMVFHLQNSQIDLARTIGRKALKKISFREHQELLNIWIALLNLELRFSEYAAFESVLNEALLVNDPFKVYGKCLTMLADVKKVPELSAMILNFTKKFRTQPDCWSIAAQCYFEVGLAEKAKQLLNRALTSLPDRDHIQMIVKFANLNNKYDNKNTAHALMEQILTSYPKRVDCWSQYVDMLVKDNEIELARQILDRAVVQKIPMKKMRTIFKKYLDFETKYGDDISIQKVKGMASNYVENQIKS